MTPSPSPEQVLSASPEGLVLMLFEGALRFGAEAREAALRDDRAEAARLTGRVRAIVEELDRGLNPEAGSIARHLGSIYGKILLAWGLAGIIGPLNMEYAGTFQHAMAISGCALAAGFLIAALYRRPQPRPAPVPHAALAPAYGSRVS